LSGWRAAILGIVNELGHRKGSEQLSIRYQHISVGCLSTISGCRFASIGCGGVVRVLARARGSIFVIKGVLNYRWQPVYGNL
jgi:hypothetical protein